MAVIGEQTGRGNLLERLEALAYPARLELVGKLRKPRPIGEIELTSAGDQGGSGRVITREGVRHHLNKLRKANLVETRPARSQGRHEHEYVTRTEELYSLGHELAMMAHRREDEDARTTAPITWDEPEPTGPALRVVHGARIGTSYPLTGRTSTPNRGWIVGRGPKADVDLDWDPDVDDQAAEVMREDDGFVVVDLRAAGQRISRNGNRLERGETRPLENGDLLGVGRSLLAFSAT